MVRARLFESFFTTKPHGIGLGLSVVRTILDAHGARVRAELREGGGTVFTVWLPRLAEQAGGRPAGGQAGPRAAARVEPWREGRSVHDCGTGSGHPHRG
jgi:hypothetical protein